MKNMEDKAQESVDIATAILKSLGDDGVDEITAQAALGNAWYRMCRGMKYDPTTFWTLLNTMGKIYEKNYEERKSEKDGRK